MLSASLNKTFPSIIISYVPNQFKSLQALGQLKHTKYTDNDIINKKIYLVYYYSLGFRVCVLDIYMKEFNKEGRKKMFFFNDALNTFYLRLVKNHPDSERETRCRHMGYSIRFAGSVLLYAQSHRHDSTYHGLCYTSRGVHDGTRYCSLGPP